MKVKIGPYRERFLSSYKITKLLEDKLKEEHWDKLDDFVQNIFDWCWNYPLDKLGLLYTERKISVHIDPYDTWNADHTLAIIIVPVLEQLRDTNHGTPYVDDTDVPEELRTTKEIKTAGSYGHTQGIGLEDDDLHQKRWLYVINEMIWAFKEIRDDNPGESSIREDKEAWEEYFKRIERGTTLFGKYFQALWD